MKKCPFCAEDIQDAAIVCRFCNRDLLDPRPPTPTTPVAAGKSLYERKVILEKAIQSQFSADMRIESQSDHQAVLVFGRTPNHLLHFFIGLFTLGFWWIVWLLLALAGREHRRMITVDELGRVITDDTARIKGRRAASPQAATTESTQTPEEIEKQRRRNHRLGTALVAIVIGAAILVVGIGVLSTLMRSSPRTAALREVTATAPTRSAQTPLRPSSTTSTREAIAAPTWRELKTWSGSGMKETEAFQTAGREWRIRWKARNEPFPNAGILQIFVYNGSGELISLAANKQGPGEDESYVRSSPGAHYLQINSANIDWTVSVEERR